MDWAKSESLKISFGGGYCNSPSRRLWWLELSKQAAYRISEPMSEIEMRQIAKNW